MASRRSRRKWKERESLHDMKRRSAEAESAYRQRSKQRDQQRRIDRFRDEAPGAPVWIVRSGEEAAATPVGYEDYLRSAKWQRKRRAALARAEHRCQVCSGRDRLNVHHRTYERLGDERPADLTVLCETCHEIFHRHGRLDPMRATAAAG